MTVAEYRELFGELPSLMWLLDQDEEWITNDGTVLAVADAARWFAADGNRTVANDLAWQRLAAALARLDEQEQP